MAHHKTTITIGNALRRPYHVQCSCTSGGDFATEEEAMVFVNLHWSRLGQAETHELDVPGARKKK
jgi:hypothetical protein